MTQKAKKKKKKEKKEICPNTDSAWSFPGVSDGKESARNVGDLRSISGLGRSPGG